jgi:hypothetical protein
MKGRGRSSSGGKQCNGGNERKEGGFHGEEKLK